jgi:hypothetical protein
MHNTGNLEQYSNPIAKELLGKRGKVALPVPYTNLADIMRVF